MTKTQRKAKKVERHLIVSDFQIPDYHKPSLKLVLQVIKHFKPDTLHILGDFVNFTEVSSYDPSPYYDVGLMDEVTMAKAILNQLATNARDANNKVSIKWYEGNHEERLLKYLGRQAKALAKLEIDGEPVVSIPHLFELKEMGIEWLDYGAMNQIDNVVFNHGFMSRGKSGYASHAMIERMGMSGIQGHSHKLAHITKKQLNDTKFWIEAGSLCNSQPHPRYAHTPDFVLGFASIIFKDGKAYPQIHPIINDSVRFEGEIFTA